MALTVPEIIDFLSTLPLDGLQASYSRLQKAPRYVAEHNHLTLEEVRTIREHIKKVINERSEDGKPG